MRRIRLTLHIALITFLIASGIPVFGPGDMNRDGTVDLEDAIMGVRNFAHSAENPSAFADAVADALTSLSVAAGLATSIIPARDQNSQNPSSILQACYTLTLPVDLTSSSPFFRVKGSDVFLYQSAIVLPASPPPRILTV
ncbi:MAG: hypothetical protein M0P57_13880 [Syntrophales bacterium]|jgi:hypothetical protein|nr:hypothetical protein [Syntrophales bacterium]